MPRSDIGPSIYKQSQESQEQAELEVGVQQPQHDEPVVHSARYEEAKSKSNGPITAHQPDLQKHPRLDGDEISITDRLKSELTIHAPGLKFPIKRDGLIQLAESFRNEFQNKYHKTSASIEHPLYIIKKLPRDLVYRDEQRLGHDLITIARKSNKLDKTHFIRDGTPKYTGCYFETFDSPNIDNEKFKSDTMEVLNYMAQTELESKKQELEKWQPNSKEDLKFKERELKKIADALTYRPSSKNSLLNQLTQS